MHMVWQIQLKFEMGSAPSEGFSTVKMVIFRSGTIDLWLSENSIFLVPIKHTCLSHACAGYTYLAA